MTVIYGESAGIAVIALNRPDALNALDLPTLQCLEELLDTAAASTSAGAVILTGTGSKAFSAGPTSST